MTGLPDAESSVRRLSAVVEMDGGWLTVELRGQLDVATAPALVDRVGKLIVQETPPRIALMLSQVSFCDSSGLNAFVRLCRQAEAAGGELVRVGPGPRLTERLRWTGLNGRIRVCKVLPKLPER